MFVLQEIILKRAGTHKSRSRPQLDKLTLITAFGLLVLLLLKPVKREPYNFLITVLFLLIDHEIPTYTKPVTQSSQPVRGAFSSVLRFDDELLPNKVV